MNPDNISFKKLTVDDFPLLHEWLNSPHVKEWYGKHEKSDLEAIIAKYSPRIEGKEPTKCFIAYYGGKPFGFIQSYMISDHPDYAKYSNIDFEAASVDLFIGEEEFMGKGLGSLMLKKFLKDIVFGEMGAYSCVIGPEPNNTRAIKSYEKVGFKYFKTIQIPKEPEPEYLMKLDKDDFQI